MVNLNRIMKTCRSLILLALLAHGLSAGISDVAGGNHHTYWIEDGIVYSTGQDLHKATGPSSYVGGKLGRPIDDKVLPEKDPDSLLARADYNPGPRPVRGLDGQTVVKVASGQNDGAALTAGGLLFMWGPNDHGQLGLGDTKQRREAVRIPLPDGVRVRDVAIGNAHTLVLSEDGRVYGMGLNRNGVLGLGFREQVSVPTLIPGFEGKRVVAIAAAQNSHSLFLTAAGDLYGCGRNAAYALADVAAKGARVCRIVRIPTAESFVAIGVGVRTSFAITAEGALYAWGDGSKAHFARTLPGGSADLSDLRRPTRIENAPPEIVEVAAGSRHTVVRTAGGDVYTWGIHTVLSGQLGIGKPSAGEPGGIAGEVHAVPQQVGIPGDAPAVSLDSMANNVFLLTGDGAMYGWGSTAHGRLGGPVNAFDSAETVSGATKYLAYEPVRLGKHSPARGK